MQSLLALNVADAVGLGVVLTGVWKAWSGRPRGLLRRGRVRHLGELGVSRSAVRVRVEDLLAGEPSSPAQELNWLAQAIGLDDDRAATFPDAARANVGPFQRATLISTAYARYAADLDAGTLLGAHRAPVVREESERARAVSKLAKTFAALEELGSEDRDRENRLRVPARQMEIQFLGLSAVGRSALGPQEVYVSYRDSRLVTDRSAGPHGRRSRHLDVPEDARTRLEDHFKSPLAFDGVLPRVVDLCTVRDVRSGRRGVHLSLAETTYGAWVVDHYPRELTGGAPRPVNGEVVGGLTLSSVVATRCGHLLFARRSSRSGSHRGLLGPTINGNLEFEPRRGISVDLDANGLPDLRGALLREGREELGLEVEPSRLTFTGLARFWVPEEKGTHVLVSCSTVDLDRTEVALGMQRADPIEGAWENDYELVSLAVPRSTAERYDAINWLVGSRELTPHATAAGLGALALVLRTDVVLDEAMRRSGRKGRARRPASVEWYSAERGWVRQ